MTTVKVLSSSASKALLDALIADSSAKAKWKKASDACIADGITSKMIDKSNRASNVETLIGQVEAIVLQSFNKTELAIFQKDKAKCSEAELVTRRHVVTEKASRYSKIVNHIKKMEDSELLDDKTKGAQTPKAGKKPKEAKAQVAWYIDHAIRTLQAMTNPEIGVSTDIKTLQVIEAKYKTNV
jgi:uncharacterized protein YjgD (DUF1641 family)